jgi:hypothetical protein
MNVREAVKPTYGVSIIEGKECSQRGPDYSTKANSLSMRMSKKDYREKYESFEVSRHTAFARRKIPTTTQGLSL